MSNRRSVVISSVVVAVVVAVVGVGIAVQAARDDAATSSGSASGGSASGGSASGGGTDVESRSRPSGVAVGRKHAPVTVTVYEDFLCPACRMFEEANGDLLKAYVKTGDVRVVYRPIAILDRYSTTDYSTRALNAAACVVEEGGPPAFQRFHHELFANQPPEGGPGLDDQTLVDLAALSGVAADDVAPCVEEQQFRGWTRRVTDEASKAGVTGTPTVLVDGMRLDGWSADDLTSAIAASLDG